MHQGEAFHEGERWTLLSRTPEETFRLGEDFGKRALGGEVIALIGPLGAGKTLFVKGLGKGLAIPESSISSPTFVLMHTHEGRLPLYHIDLYRLESKAAIEAIGLDEFVEGNGVAAVEWADKGEGLLPPESLKIEISYAPVDPPTGSGDRRDIILTASGSRYKTWIDQVRASEQWKVQS